MADVDFAKAARALEGPAFIAVGFGVLGFQRAQVYRRDMEKRAVELAGTVRSLSGELGQRLAPAHQVVDDVAGDFALQLPPEAVELARAASTLVGALPREARELAKEAVAVGRFAVQVLRAPVAKRAAYP
jgi:hypothetical protein